MSLQINVVCDECGDICRTACYNVMPAIRTAVGRGWKIDFGEGYEARCARCIQADGETVERVVFSVAQRRKDA